METATELSARGLAIRIALLLLLSLPPLLAGLGASDCIFHMEVRTVASSLETWQRGATDANAWLVPSWNGQPRVNKPPLAVWITLLSWRGLSPDAPVDTLVLRARLAGVLCALLALLATAWLGRTLVSLRFGLAAGAVMGSSLFFLRQARMATYDLYLLTFCTLAVAAGVWAMQPAHPERRRPRHALGWVLAGLALGLAILAKGPLALLLAGAPLVLMSLQVPERRRIAPRALLTLLLGLLVAMPWYLYILRTVPQAGELLWREYEAERVRGQPPWYYLGLIGLVFPWTLWLLAGVVATARRHRPAPAAPLGLVAGWFFWILIAMSLPEAKQQRYILPILPAASLLAVAGGWFADPLHRLTRGWATAHASLLGLASVAVAGLGFLSARTLAHLGLEAPAQAGWPTGWSLGPGLILFGLALFIGRSARAGWTERALWGTALWMAAAATPGLYGYAHAARSQYAHRTEVEQVAALTHGQPFVYLTGPYTEPQYEHPDPRFRLYARRVIPGLNLREINQLAPPAWVTAPVHKNADRDLKRNGWMPVLDYRDKGPVRRLYRRDAVPDPA